MPYKARSKEEIENIVKDFESGQSAYDVSKKYKISETSLYQLLNSYHGVTRASDKRKSHQTKIKKLEKSLAEKDKEIALLKAALKKS